MTFKNAEPLRNALRRGPAGPAPGGDRRAVPHARCPYRGRTNASYLVPLTMRVMAEVRGDDLGELCAAVDGNTERGVRRHLVAAQALCHE